MTNEPNLKEIKRKAYTSYHQDGLLDIFVSVYIIGFPLGILLNEIWNFDFALFLPAILAAIVLPIWILLKRKVTMPRVGYVNFGTKGPANANAIALFTGLIATGVTVFFVFTIIQGEQSYWMDLIFQNALILLGITSLVICALFGYTMGLKRFYVYGSLSLIALTIGHFAGIFFAYIILAIGIVVMITGVALLIAFIKKYPLQGERAIAK